MSFLLEALGKGLVGDLYGATATLFPRTTADALGEPLDEESDAPCNPELLIRRACAHLARESNHGLACARRLFERAARLDSDNLAAHLGQSCVADRLGQNAAAIHHLEQALIRRPGDPILQFALGASCEKLDEKARAEQVYEQALHTCPTLRNARERLAAVQILRGNLESAAFHYALLRAAQPQNITPHLILGNLRLVGGDAEAAADAFEDALSVQTDCCPGRDDPAAGLLARGRHNEALNWLLRAREQGPDYADLSVRIGDILAADGRNEAALREYLLAVETSPEYLEASVKTGTQLLRMGRYEQASRWFARAVEINDRLVVGYVGLALARQESGQTRAAAETLDMAAGIEPNSTLLFSEAARLSLRFERIEAAGPDPDTGHPKAGDEPHGKGASSVYTVSDVVELLDAMILHLDAWLRHRPNHANTHYRKAVLLRSRGRIREANAVLAHVVRIHPSCSRALIKLGLGLRELGQHEEAHLRFRQALGYDRRSLLLHHRLALMFTQRPGFDNACREFAEHLGSRADWVDPTANLYLALENLGMLEPEPPFTDEADLLPDDIRGAGEPRRSG